MSPLILRVAFASGIAVLGLQNAVAASLQASPVLIEMSAGAPSAVVNVRNTGNAGMSVQTRVFRWTQNGGKESLVETDDVVTSPPITTLKPGTNYSIRVVKVNNRPVAKEESYRVLVDQLPDPGAQRNGTVALVMRHSIPVFMLPANAGQASIDWTVSSRNNRLVIHARNSGDRRVRLSRVSVKMPDGRTVNFGDGLLGYVLAGSSMEWVSPSTISGSAVAGARIIATSDLGQIDVKANASR